MSSLSFGFARPDDIDEVVALVQSAYRGEHSRRGWTTEAELIDGQRIDAAMLTEVLETPGTVVLVARSGNRLVACCEIHRTDVPSPHSPTTATFGMFAVDPDHQDAGIGSQVLAEAERIAAGDWGLQSMQLTVIDVRRELISWYQRRGYEPTGETRPFPHGDERFGLPRRDDLRFMVMEKSLTVS
jgi:GNAT superfamily N-acetyltransferase